MIVELICSICNSSLHELGGILFSPPNGSSFVVKHHICVDCYLKLMGRLECRKMISHTGEKFYLKIGEHSDLWICRKCNVIADFEPMNKYNFPNGDFLECPSCLDKEKYYGDPRDE